MVTYHNNYINITSEYLAMTAIIDTIKEKQSQQNMTDQEYEKKSHQSLGTVRQGRYSFSKNGHALEAEMQIPSSSTACLWRKPAPTPWKAMHSQ